MPDLRTNKSVSERFDTEFNWRPEPALRRWRRTLMWVCAILPLVLLGVYEVVGDGRLYWSAPLTEKHRKALEEERGKGGEIGCNICHTKLAQPLWRLVTGSNRPCSVDDTSCLHCHTPKDGKLPKDHHASMRDQDIRGCAVCHEEHRVKTDKKLWQVSDVRCVECHGDLKSARDDMQFYANIKTFKDHPEFAASRFRGGKAIEANEMPKSKHGVYDSVEFKEGKLVDKTPLRFSHAAHLKPDGVPQLGDEVRDDDAKREVLKKLVCVDCHPKDSNGDYRAAIEYERHCKSCHPLSYSTLVNSIERGGPFRHVELSLVYKDAKDRLGMPADPSRSTEEPRLPTKRPTPGQTGTDEQGTWGDIKSAIEAGCRHCHQLEPVNSGAASTLEVRPPSIPPRWMPHSKFDHKKHDEYSCVLCHDHITNSKKLPYKRGIDPEQERTLPSSQTADILMPSITVCQHCHTKGRPESGKSASTDCIECHKYHHKPSDAN